MDTCSKCHEDMSIDMSPKRNADPARERTLAIGNGWSSGFVEILAAARADVEAQRAMKSLRVAVSANRTRKSPLGS